MTLTQHTEQEDMLNQHLPHLTQSERAGLAAFIGRLRHCYGDDLLRVVLFGSKARGDFDDESDLDVLVVVRMAGGDYRRYWDEIVDTAWDIEWDHGIVTSLVIKDDVGYTNMREHQSLLARNIEQDGVELWTTRPNMSTSEFV